MDTYMVIHQKMGWLCRHDFVIDSATLDISEATEILIISFT